MMMMGGRLIPPPSLQYIWGPPVYTCVLRAHLALASLECLGLLNDYLLSRYDIHLATSTAPGTILNLRMRRADGGLFTEVRVHEMSATVRCVVTDACLEWEPLRVYRRRFGEREGSYICRVTTEIRVGQCVLNRNECFEKIKEEAEEPAF